MFELRFSCMLHGLMVVQPNKKEADAILTPAVFLVPSPDDLDPRCEALPECKKVYQAHELVAHCCNSTQFVP